MSENNHRGPSASDSAVDYAVQAGKRLRDAAAKAGDAYADACQQTILGVTDFKPGDCWHNTGGIAFDVDEVARAGKQIGRAYIDVLERATFITIEMRERFAAATNTDWVISMARTQAALERDAANACFAQARGLLT